MPCLSSHKQTFTIQWSHHSEATQSLSRVASAESQFADYVQPETYRKSRMCQTGLQNKTKAEAHCFECYASAVRWVPSARRSKKPVAYWCCFCQHFLVLNVVQYVPNLNLKSVGMRTMVATQILNKQARNVRHFFLATNRSIPYPCLRQ